GSISNYIYGVYSGFEADFLPFNTHFFQPHNTQYSGEQNLTIIGDLNIPNNSLIPSNSKISAVGQITIGADVVVGSNSIIESGTKIILDQPLIINPNVDLRISEANIIKYNCESANYSNSHLSRDEINSFCNKTAYKLRAFSASVQEVEKTEDSAIFLKLNSKLDMKLKPNPVSGNVTIMIFNHQNKNYDIEIIDLSGRTHLKASVLGAEPSLT